MIYYERLSNLYSLESAVVAITKEINKEELDEGANSGCSQHWMIGDPDGPMSAGICKHCGAQKEFMNYFEGSSWGSEVSLDRLSRSEGVSKDSDYSSVAQSIKAEDAF